MREIIKQRLAEGKKSIMGHVSFSPNTLTIEPLSALRANSEPAKRLQDKGATIVFPYQATHGIDPSQIALASASTPKLVILKYIPNTNDLLQKGAQLVEETKRSGPTWFVTNQNLKDKVVKYTAFVIVYMQGLSEEDQKYKTKFQEIYRPLLTKEMAIEAKNLGLKIVDYVFNAKDEIFAVLDDEKNDDTDTINKINNIIKKYAKQIPYNKIPFPASFTDPILNNARKEQIELL